jgi:Putative restriction endonuclease
MSTATLVIPDVIYPESDGKPMADNTIQWDWMVKVVDELRIQYVGQEVFVAGDLLWYPVKGMPKISAAPDAMVVFGRPAGNRRSYLQWNEDGLGPQVVFEVLSHSNRADELEDKLSFYDEHGVEEYYLIDPYEQSVEGYTRGRSALVPVRKMLGFVSPRLGTRFEKIDGELVLVSPSGRSFQSRGEQVGELSDGLKRARSEKKRMAEELKRESSEKKRIADELKRERSEKERLAAKLRELGIDPDA